MKETLLQWLRCPKCKGRLELSASEREGQEIVTGNLGCKPCARDYPIVRSIPRFVPSDNYVGNFSFQWNLFARTRIEPDLQRFTKQTGLGADDLRGKLVLDVGIGAGRYSDIVERSGATVVGIDLSFSVEAARDLLAGRERAHVVQASVFELPFATGTFDVIFSIGVLHHTPDCHKAFLALPPLLRPGGKLGVCVYTQSGSKTEQRADRFWRSLSTRLPNRALLVFCAIATALTPPPVIKRILRFVLPGGIWELLPKMHDGRGYKVRLQKNFDWYSPKYQSYHTYAQVSDWFAEAGMTDVRVLAHRTSVKGRKASA